MISTFADLLEAFRQKESQLLDKQNIKHAPTIGRMYEGLTRNLLEKTLPEGLDLKVVSGFITNDRGELSKQIDCMLVMGEGENIPYTDDYKYHIKDVIVVIEVKKNLYTNELDSAYQNLISVHNLLYADAFPENRLFNDAHRSILRSDPNTYEDITKLPVWKFQLGLALFIESVTPVRVVFGYHGFSSETNFREAFINYLDNKKLVRGYGPADFPSLIISGGYSLIKLNGMPYSIPVANNQAELYTGYGMPNLAEDAPVKSDLWSLYASYADNPLLLLLELIWTRITYSKEIYFPEFSFDLYVENLKLLLLAKAIEQEEDVGWYYEYFALPPNILDRIPAKDSWQPVELDKAQYTVLAVLILIENSGTNEGIDINSPEFTGEFEEFAHSLNDSIEYFRKVGLVSVENGILRFLARECKIAVLPDGRVVAGEDVSGRFSAWMAKFTEEFTSQV